MAADAELHPADGWKSVLCVKGCSSGTRAWVYFLLVLIISCVFHWNVFTSAVRSNELSVDTYFYVETARELTRLFAGEDAYVDPLRTPGYPLILMGFAALQGVDLRDTGMSPENWTEPNASGSALLQSIQIVQQALFFCLPLLLYGVFFLASRSPLVGFLCSMSYYADICTLLYQHAILVESMSIFCVWIAVFLFVWFLRWPRLWLLALLALAIGVFTWIRPPLALFAPLFAVGIFCVLRRKGTWQRALAAATGFVGASAVIPVLWCLFQLFFGIGHFIYTSNAVFTLQLFASPKLLQMEVTDPELQVMQRQIYEYRKNGGHSGFVMTAIQQDVMKKLGMEDYYDYYKLKQKAVFKTICAFPLDFLQMGWDNFKLVWTEENEFTPSYFVLLKEPKIALFRFLATRWLPFGPATLPLLAVLCVFLSLKTQDQTQRVFLLSCFAFVVLFTFFCTFVSPDCPERHTVQARLMIFALCFYCLVLILGKVGRGLLARLGRQDRGEAFFQNSVLIIAVAVFGLWLPLNAGYDRNFSDLEEIRSALEQFHADHGSYPVSPGWSGLKSPDGLVTPEWIPGLTPRYLERLPEDPRSKGDPRTQYVYRSDGRDYKLISHGAFDCDQVNSRMPERVDPARVCYAYGFWTPGARLW